MKDIVFAYFLGVNVLAFIVYGIDKLKAISGRWRIPEIDLICCALIGGAPGALLGMLIFRHKIRKPKFIVGVPLILLIEIIIALYIFR